MLLSRGFHSNIHRLISAVQGRPLAFADDCIDFAFPAIICDDTDSHTMESEHTYVEHFEYRLQWARLISGIKSTLYKASTYAPPLPANVSRDFQADMLARLGTWLMESLKHAQTLRSQTRRLHIELEIDYHYAICILYQPSVGCPKPDTAAIQRCYDSAAQRLRLSWSLHGESCLLLTWLTTQCISLAGSTMAYCIWNSEELRSSVSLQSFRPTSASAPACWCWRANGGPLRRRAVRVSSDWQIPQYSR